MTTSPRTHILLAGTAVAALMTAGAARAQSINSGGSTLASPTYELAFQLYATTNPTPDFIDYYNPSGSGAAQQALITNVANASGGATPFYLGASDATANDAAQVDPTGTSPPSIGTAPYLAWQNPGNAEGQSAAGDLIIVPSIGTPITVALNLSGVASNTSVNLSDAQLCGIFSGAITTANDGRLGGSGIPTSAGTLHPVYRLDGSGTSFLFTQHLAAVCPLHSGSSAITFRATTSFASLFTTVPSNFVGGTGSPGVQAGIDKTGTSLGYLSPDYTKIVTNPNGGAAAAPYVAEVNGVQPTVAQTSAALSTGTPTLDGNLNKTNTPYNPQDPNSFVPVAANPRTGYPIVGYTTIWVAQCYSDPNVASAIRGFLTSLYRTPLFRTLESNGGFAPLPTALVTQISNNYLSTTAGTEINGGRAGDCASYAGR